MTTTTTPAEDILREANVEPMPVANAHVTTVNIEAALLDIGHATTALENGEHRQAEQYLKRALNACTMARQNLLSAQGIWRSYNDRLDRLVTFLNDQDRP